MVGQHPKRDYLRAAGALHAHPETVRAELFQRHRFFDPLDKVQVKYEMLRAQAVEGESVSSAAAGFGFSRETFYQTLRAFEERGIVGLCDDKRGRRGPVKLTADAIAWVNEVARERPELSGRELAQRLGQERGISVHRRTVERLVMAGGKNR
ncbi:MAG: helix-turn-helix domain-containing protein [Dehalococcoidia bacterium]